MAAAQMHLVVNRITIQESFMWPELYIWGLFGTRVWPRIRSSFHGVALMSLTHVQIWKKTVCLLKTPGESHEDECLQATARHYGGSCWIWSCVSLKGLGAVGDYIRLLPTTMPPGRDPIHPEINSAAWDNNPKLISTSSPVADGMGGTKHW